MRVLTVSISLQTTAMYRLVVVFGCQVCHHQAHTESLNNLFESGILIVHALKLMNELQKSMFMYSRST